MDAEQQDSRDQDLADELAARDEALARGERRSAHSSAELGDTRLEKKLECMKLLRQALPRRRSAGSSASWSRLSQLTFDLSLAPTTVGRFQVRRELGRGAFGVVYLAFDPNLGRDVALKVPRFDLLLTPSLLGRFQTEARAAAGLDHPNIVQLFEAGEFGSSFYLASAYCPGIGLDEWLRRRRLPVPVDWAADTLIALADAVEHAHSRGVLHRDLKPANILLTGKGLATADDTQIIESPATVEVLPAPMPKITDFGLAKLDPLLGSPHDESWEQLHQTRSGAVVGTPAYMAPEQAGSPTDVVGPTADVYALGVILYELLTGRPPFLGQSVLDTLHAVRTADPVPPSRLRAKLPRDVETICLKCLEKDPRRRYPSAKALAGDLRRFRKLEPIIARPASTTEHVVRWCRRNPQAAGLSAALLWVAILGVVGIFWQWRRAQAEATVAKDGETAANNARRVALVARDRADAEGRRARDAVERMTAAGIELYKQQGQQEAGRKILEQAAAFHEGFVAERSNDPEVMTSACVAWNKLGWIREELGQRSAAIAAMRRAVELATQLLDMAPDDDACIMRRAKSSQDLARCLLLADRYSESSAAFETAETFWRRSYERAPDDDDRVLRLANSLLNHAVALEERDRAAAEAMYLEALKLQRANLSRRPRDLVYRREVALTTEALALLAWRRGDQKRAEDYGAEAVSLLGVMEKEYPRNEQCRWYAARCRLNIGGRLYTAGLRQEGSSLLYAGYRGMRGLRNEFPRNLQYLESIVTAAGAVGQLHELTGESAAAEADYRYGAEQFLKLQAASPERARSVRVTAMKIHLTLAAQLATSLRLKDAYQVLRTIPFGPPNQKPATPR